MSFIRKVFDKEGVVKSNLVTRIADCIKELQFKNASDTNTITLVNDEATNTLCWVLEAVFIHGLQSPFLKSMSSALRGAGASTTRIPEPSFWEFVLIFCHQEVIMQINQLSLITSDVGRCRAWLRLTLNDGLLHSYLQLMSQDKSTLRAYYKPSAFLRDSEKCDVMKSYLFGLESCKFSLAANSSLLNVWNSGPLSLIGMWNCSSDSVSEGVDVASNMDSDEMQTLPKLHQGRTPPTMPSYLMEQLYKAPLLDEDEALRVILSSGKRQTAQPGPSQCKKIVPISATPLNIAKKKNKKHHISSSTGTFKKEHKEKEKISQKNVIPLTEESKKYGDEIRSNNSVPEVIEKENVDTSGDIDISCGSSSGIFDTSSDLSSSIQHMDLVNEIDIKEERKSDVGDGIRRSLENSGENVSFAALFQHLDQNTIPSGDVEVVETTRSIANMKSDVDDDAKSETATSRQFKVSWLNSF